MNIIGHQTQQEHIAQQLDHHHLTHAILLHGPVGIGKSVFAHELAAAFLCESDNTWACGQCQSCHLLRGEVHPDFLSLSRSYNDKQVQNRDLHIAQVRNLLHFIGLTGTRSQKRVVVVNDADRMNHQAANALLKGLEEPTAGCLICLVCENIQRLPITIRSRCVLLSFGALNQQDCQQVFTKMQIEKQYLPLAQRIANGQPGKVMDLCQEVKAQAYLALSELMKKPLNVLALQAWIDSHLSTLSYPLVVEIIRTPYMKQLNKLEHFGDHNALSQALWDLACWPERLRAHSLRPAPSLLAHILHLEDVLTHA